MKHAYTYYTVLFFLLISTTIQAQFSANNLMEIQRGNLIGSEPDNLITIFDQLDMRYISNNIRFSTRINQFHSNEKNDYEYIEVSQFSAIYRKHGLEINAGNFYETLGRGLLLRAYEIKNSILEDRIYRSRQGFYRDLLGASGSYRYKFIQIKGLWGKSLNNQLPNGHEDRRIDIVGAGEVNFQIKEQTIGAIYLNHQIYNQVNNFGSIYFGGNLFNLFDYYGEFAHAFNPVNNKTNFSENDKYGMYFNLNYSNHQIGFSFELKNYHNFVIGSGIADPPTLIKEHSYRLLNRITHVAEFLDEHGYQLEVFYNTGKNTFFTFNHSLGKNQFGNLEYNFYEFFVDANHKINNYQFKIFADFSKDEIVGEKNRITAGVYVSKALNNSWSVEFDTEEQVIERNNHNFFNSYWSLTISKSSKFSASVQYELTTDPLLINTDKLKAYPAINIGYQIKSKNKLQLFAGQRRGGPACTSGVCYEVLEFKGIELRYSYKL